MLGLRSQEHQNQNPIRSTFKPRDASPDSVIFTQHSNFSLFSSASPSVDRTSPASGFHDNESLLHELSKHLAGPDHHKGGPHLDSNSGCTVQKSSRGGDRAKDSEDEEEHDTEDDSNTLGSARNSFSHALRECQNRRLKPEGHLVLKKPDRRRPASLDLNNPRTTAFANSASPRFGGMKKSTISSRKSGAYPSPGTPNHWQAAAAVQKGWSSERVPLPQNGSRRNVGMALLPFNSGRTLPSKWEDAEKWIFSPVSGDGINRALVPIPQRRPKSKSGPLGPPGVAYYSMYSPSMPTFERGNGVNFMEGSPFSAGVFTNDRLPSHIQRSVGCGNGGSYPETESCITRSASVHGWSSDRLSQSLPGSQDEKVDDITEESNLTSRAVSRRDMATQMSPDSSGHSSPKGRLSFSLSPHSFLPIMESDGCHSSKVEVRDVQIDDRVTMTRSSRKHKVRGLDCGFTTVGDCKKKPAETQASTWDVSEVTKSMAKSKRDEVKITAWENLQKAKAEAAIRKLEMKLEKKRSSSMDKIMNKLRLAQKKAQDMRNSESVSQSHQVSRTSKRITSFRRCTQISSLSGCFTCHAF